MDHLRNVAEAVNRRWRRARFERVAVGGPQEVLGSFVDLLADEGRSRLAPGRLDLDLSNVTEAQVRDAVEKLVLEASAARCPADGGPTEAVEYLREAAVEAAIVQGAEVVVVREYPDEAPRQGIGAVLRF